MPKVDPDEPDEVGEVLVGGGAVGVGVAGDDVAAAAAGPARRHRCFSKWPPSVRWTYGAVAVGPAEELGDQEVCRNWGALAGPRPSSGGLAPGDGAAPLGPAFQSASAVVRAIDGLPDRGVDRLGILDHAQGRLSPSLTIRPTSASSRSTIARAASRVDSAACSSARTSTALFSTAAPHGVSGRLRRPSASAGASAVVSAWASSTPTFLDGLECPGDGRRGLPLAATTPRPRRGLASGGPPRAWPGNRPARPRRRRPFARRRPASAGSPLAPRFARADRGEGPARRRVEPCGSWRWTSPRGRRPRAGSAGLRGILKPVAEPGVEHGEEGG